MIDLPYCGAPPVPADIWQRFNLDPLLMLALAGVAALHLRIAPADRRAALLAGWGVAAAGLLSPLCALSVALFSARVAQHMLLALVAAPLVAFALPGRSRLAPAVALFMAALWAWHLPGLYELSFRSDLAYWTMHATLFGGAVWLWRGLLHHPADALLPPFAAGLFTTMGMGFLGAILALSPRLLFTVHLGSAGDWGLDPREDQALGGLLMWVPGTALFMAVALRSLVPILREEGAAV